MALLRGFLQVLAFGALTLSYTPVCAQSAEALNAAIKEMFDRGDKGFLLAMAMQDGLIKEGNSYDFRYKDGVFSVDGKAIPEPYRSRYAAFWSAFYSGKGPDMLSLRGDGFTRADIIDLRSSIRKCGGSRVNGMPVISPYSVFSSLEYDGLVKPGGRFKLSYTAGGLMLNGHPIPDELAAKYRFFLSDLALSAGYRDFQPRTDTDIVTVER